MAYIEVYATIQGSEINSKKRLRELVGSEDARVHLHFEAVSPLGRPYGGGLDILTEDTTLQVTGPNPWTKRNWYANIKVSNGKFKVS